MYENNTEEVLKGKMLSSIASGISKSEGYFVYDAIAPAAKKLAECYAALDIILKLIFGEPAQEIPQEDYDRFMDKDAERHGLKRKQGICSIGEVTFTGIDNSIINENSIVQTIEGLKYKVTSQAKIINGKCTVGVAAMEIGSKYNVPSNTIVQIPIKINGIISVSNLNPMTSGTDRETSKELLERIISKERDESSSGNVYDYEKWAMEVSGVESVKVKPLWKGNGTVKIIVSGDNGSQLDDTILEKVKEYIDAHDGQGFGKAPIGATVTVISVTPIKIDVKIQGLTIEDKFSLEDVQLNIKKSLNAYFEKLPVGGIVKINAVEAVIMMTEGVSDLTSIKLNDEIKNIPVLEENKAALGGIAYE